jgi:hypothetical protein
VRCARGSAKPRKEHSQVLARHEPLLPLRMGDRLFSRSSLRRGDEETCLAVLSWSSVLAQDRAKPALYSFRDVLALRAFAILRQDVSLQKIRKALATLKRFGEFEHLSSYSLVAEGDFIVSSNCFLPDAGQPGSVRLSGPWRNYSFAYATSQPLPIAVN